VAARLGEAGSEQPGPRLWPLFAVVLCDGNAAADLSVRLAKARDEAKMSPQLLHNK
jgi:hypothetical protein